jgi:hypothetical protein
MGRSGTGRPSFLTKKKKRAWKKIEDRVKILTFCMTHRLSERVVGALANQTGVEFFDTHFTNDNPHLYEERGQYKNMMLNWQKMERLVKFGDYDKVWMVEDDTIPPRDALKRLLESNALVVSGLYASRYEPYRPSAYKRKGEPFSWEELKEVWGKEIEVAGNGTGCMLIDRGVFDSYSIDMAGYESGEHGYSSYQIDALFSNYCVRTGIKHIARLDVLCGHVKSNGDILWPDKEIGFKIETVN